MIAHVLGYDAAPQVVVAADSEPDQQSDVPTLEEFGWSLRNRSACNVEKKNGGVKGMCGGAEQTHRLSAKTV
jgi:hypothetical protein